VIAVAVIALFADQLPGVLLGGRVQTILTSTKVISILAVPVECFCTVVPRLGQSRASAGNSTLPG